MKKKIFEMEFKGNFYGGPIWAERLNEYLRGQGFTSEVSDFKVRKGFKINVKEGNLEMLISVKRKRFNKNKTVYSLKTNKLCKETAPLIAILGRYDPKNF